MAATPELFYFNGPGRANLTRLAFIAGGVEFTDTRVADWPTMKGDPASTPARLFGSMPAIQHGELLVGQSIAVALYAAELGGLMGDGPRSRGGCYMAAVTNEDLRGVMYKPVSIRDVLHSIHVVLVSYSYCDG